MEYTQSKDTSSNNSSQKSSTSSINAQKLELPKGGGAIKGISIRMNQQM
ncbi:hypothetical protein [Wolbachia endosymbiont of Chironomus riparius]|nr:hypothetical protein [Wolbachia endosymbiont of Chironomus riparius]